MTPSDVLSHAITLCVFAPPVAAVLAFKGGESLRVVSRVVLLCGWLACSAATLALLRYAFAKPSSGIGNQVLLFPALIAGFFAIVWFNVWRAARRHAYVISLPPDERRVEELHDIDRALEAARKSLEQAERRARKWLISSDERERLRDEISMLQSSIFNLEQERAKRA